jgi:hypothetical protein
MDGVEAKAQCACCCQYLRKDFVMKRNSGSRKVIQSAAVGFSFALGGPTFAQNRGAPSASASIHQAGEEVKTAVSDTVSAAKDAGTKTANAVRDTKITARKK